MNPKGERVCEHGVSFADFCARCAHSPVNEWVGYPLTICGFCNVPWPCSEAVACNATAAPTDPVLSPKGNQ